MAAAGKRLPPGTHGIPADVVARNQRERLIAAAAETCAEVGYAQATVADIAESAGVSSATFYKLFGGKRDCVLAAHRELLGRLLEEVDRIREGESAPGAKAKAAVGATLALLAADPPSARLLTVEILAAGPEGAKRHGAMVEAVARRLGAGGPATGDAPVPIAEWVRAAGVLALIGKLVVAGEAERLPELADELTAMLGGNLS